MLQRKYILLLFLCLFVMTGCDKEEEVVSYVSVTIEEVSYFSTQKRIYDSEQWFSLNSGFVLRYNQEMASDDGHKLVLHLRIADPESYQIGKRYEISPVEDPFERSNMASITILSETTDRKLHYYATSGWVELDKVIIDEWGRGIVSGRFEFFAKEEYSGKIIEVIGGTFHNVNFDQKYVS